MRYLLLLCMCYLSHAALMSEEQAPYSMALVVGNKIYVSAQVPINLKTGEMVEGDMSVLTDQVIDNLKKILRANGFELRQVVSTSVSLQDIRDYDAMNQAYAKRFNFPLPPVRDVVAVSDLLYNARVQISCMACKKKR